MTLRLLQVDPDARIPALGLVVVDVNRKAGNLLSMACLFDAVDVGILSWEIAKLTHRAYHTKITRVNLTFFVPIFDVNRKLHVVKLTCCRSVGVAFWRLRKYFPLLCARFSYAR